VNSLETHVLELIGESVDSPDVFADTDAGMAPIRDSINAAIEEISMLTGCGKRNYHIPMKSGYNFYTIDSRQDEVAWPTNIWLVGIGRRLERVDFRWLIEYNPLWMQNTGTPERYCIIGTDILTVHPAPSSDTDILEIEACVVPERYTSDEQRIKLRDDYQWAAVHYAVGEYYAGRGDAIQAKKFHTRYLMKLGIQGLYQETPERVWAYQTQVTQ